MRRTQGHLRLWQEGDRFGLSRRMAPALIGLSVALYLLALEVVRWLTGSDTVCDVLVWAIVLIPLVLACVISAHGR